MRHRQGSSINRPEGDERAEPSDPDGDARTRFDKRCATTTPSAWWCITGSGRQGVHRRRRHQRARQAWRRMGAKDVAVLRSGHVFTKLERMGKPTVAMINGFALGGGLETGARLHAAHRVEHGRQGASRGQPGHHSRLRRDAAPRARRGARRRARVGADRRHVRRRQKRTAWASSTASSLPKNWKKGTHEDGRHASSVARARRPALRASRRSTAA